ncbi:alpha/beta-hydrolase family protein [Geodermatophilus sabuli]|uniref:alpha/beta-hydrolase family protein n=1 Tax=Geodermatophilus sabuli TaxID=1564158 RepID=UPI000BE38CA4|nr:alpha/beta-hydrolase family protein [Geodermatophilus sabuli]MBB3084479.1 putative membrane protein [Geodermatophilus sabuli]
MALPGPGSPPDVGLVVAAATAPGTFAPSLSPRSPVDQGLVTGLATGLHFLLSVGAQDALVATARVLIGGERSPAASRAATMALDCLAAPAGLAVLRALPPRADDPLRGAVRQAAWRLGAAGLSGALLGGAQFGTRALDDRLRLGGRLAAVPLAVPVGLGVAFVLDRLRAGEHAEDTGGTRAPSPLSSLAVASGVVGSLAGAAYGEHALTDLVARRLAAELPGPPEVWRLAGHAGFLAGLGLGATSLWQRAMRRIEARTSTDVPVIEPGEADRWVASTVSGGPGSHVSWAGMGRDGRLHALASVRPRPLPDPPAGVPDLSIETVMGTPARAAPVQVYVGLDNAPTPRARVDLAMAELERTGALDRSLVVLVSPTGTGYVNYVATAALQYLALGDVATVTLQYSRRPSPLSLGLVSRAREQNRLLCLRVLQRLRERPGPRPRVVLFGESLGAHTSQDVFLHWGTLGLDAMGIDRALWIGTPYGSGWMRQVTRGDRLDVDADAVAVVNDHDQLTALAEQRGSLPRFVLLSHDNDGVTKFGPDLLWYPPDWLGPSRPRPEPVAVGSPRGIPPAMRWRPVTSFFQGLMDMKNAQTSSGAFGATQHDYRADLPRFLDSVFGLAASPEQLVRIEETLQARESVRERLFAVVPGAVG